MYVMHALNILTMFDIKFLENAWEFNRGVTSRNELKWIVLDSIPKVAVLWVLRIRLKLSTVTLPSVWGGDAKRRDIANKNGYLISNTEVKVVAPRPWE